MRFSSLALLGCLASANAKGIQSGPNAGSMHASSLIYDENDQQVYITGITYDSEFEAGVGVIISEMPSCFVSKLFLESTEFDDFDVGEIYGDPDIFETCAASALVDKHSSLVVLGNSKPQGLFADPQANLSSFGLALDKNDLSQISGIELSTTTLRYPISAIADGDFVYIVTYTAYDDQLAENQPSKDHPNWLQYQ
jgi:hypothetical protein